MGKKPGSIAAFDYGPGSLKLVELSREENRVLSAGVFPLEPGRWRDRDHLAAQIRSALDVVTNGTVERLIVSVPLGHAHLRVVEVPDDAQSARDHLEWDMGLYLARPVEQYALDGVRLRKTGPSGSAGQAWLAAAFRREEARALREIFGLAAGVPLSVLDVDAAAIVNALAVCRPAGRNERVVVVAANQDSTTLIRVVHGVFQGASLRRDSGEPLRPGADAQDRAETLLRRVRALAEDLAALEADGAKPDRVLLCGDLSADADFLELLHYRFPDPPVPFDPLATLPGPDPAEFSGSGAPLAAAVGLALRLSEET